MALGKNIDFNWQIASQKIKLNCICWSIHFSINCDKTKIKVFVVPLSTLVMATVYKITGHIHEQITHLTNNIPLLHEESFRDKLLIINAVFSGQCRR